MINLTESDKLNAEKYLAMYPDVYDLEFWQRFVTKTIEDITVMGITFKPLYVAPKHDICGWAGLYVAQTEKATLYTYSDGKVIESYDNETDFYNRFEWVASD